MSDYTIYEDMTAPTVVLTITDSDGVARSVAAAGVTVKLYIAGDSATIVDGVTMTKDGPTGQVSYVLTTTQTATPGIYEGQAEIDWGSGVVERTETFSVEIRRKV